MEPRVSILNFASNSDAMQMQICKQASVEKPPCCAQPFRHAEKLRSPFCSRGDCYKIDSSYRQSREKCGHCFASLF